MAVSLVFLALVPVGCRTYVTKTEGVRQAWQSGRIEEAVDEFTSRAERAGDGRDAVIWLLEQGTALRVAGRFEDSNRAFEQAEARMDRYAARARVRVATETMATVTTPANLPYEGRGYDKIMAATYRALNHLALGQPEAARAALIQAYQYQQDVVAENARRIERAQEEAARRGDSAVIAQTRANPQFQYQVDSLLDSSAALQPYAEYVNPFTVWMDGVFFLAQAQDSSDLERALKSLQRALAFNPDHPHLRSDLEMCERRIRGEPLPPVTWVVFATGQAPIREQVRIDIPIIFANVSYIGSAWPVLRPRDGHALTLGVSAHGSQTATATVASMDRLIARDFEAERPALVTRTLIATLAKGAAAFVANEAASQQDDALGALVRIATLAYQASVNIADTRTWTTLPKEFQVARLPTPPDRRIQLLEGSQPPLDVTIADGLLNIVYVRSVSGHTPLRVSQVRLK
jgi:hypothetical protein